VENHDQDLKINTLEVNYNTMSQKIDDLSCLVKEEFTLLKKDLKDNYVNKTEFWGVKTIVYGLVGLILIAFAGGMISLIVK
jgi:hypothetical protein